VSRIKIRPAKIEGFLDDIKIIENKKPLKKERKKKKKRKP